MYIADAVYERASGRYTCLLKDEAGLAVTADRLTALTLRLFDKATGTVLNSRSDGATGGQDALNANGVAIDGTGKLTWTVSPADNAIVTPGVLTETHRAIWRATWSGGEYNWPVDIPVVNLESVS